ncbi:MAG: hypothetical protein NVS2B6_13780 [Thermoleophilaceae bacterium]
MSHHKDRCERNAELGGSAEPIEESVESSRDLSREWRLLFRATVFFLTCTVIFAGLFVFGLFH